ncbi:MAG: Hsp20/alpha crystallin family protein [Opitutaceae bacterium]
MAFFDTLIPSFTREPARRDGASVVGIKPRFQVDEADDAYSVVCYLPGVSKENVEITAERDQLRIVGRRNWKQPDGWTAVYRESPEAPYELVLEHENALDLEKIHAEMADGVLRLSLPKAEAIKPRKIAVG